MIEPSSLGAVTRLGILGDPLKPREGLLEVRYGIVICSVVILSFNFS